MGFISSRRIQLVATITLLIVGATATTEAPTENGPTTEDNTTTATTEAPTENGTTSTTGGGNTTVVHENTTTVSDGSTTAMSTGEVGSTITVSTTENENFTTENGTIIETQDGTNGSTTTGGMTTGPTPLLAMEHYLIIAGGGGLLILLLLFCCIFICIYCCCCFKSGDKSKKSKSKKPGDDSIAQWTEEGRVQLLNIAEKAGVDDTNKSKPEAEVSGQPDGSTAVPVPPTAPPAEDKSEPDTGNTKGDNKREITVGTFGFPEVSTQPPTQPDGEVEDTEMGPVIVPIQPPEPKKQPSTVLESNSDSGALDSSVVSIGGIPLPPPPPPVPNAAIATPAGPTRVQTQAALPLHLQAPSLPVVTQGDEDDMSLPFDLGIESSILSTEVIEKALGISST